jgi:uncharacterized protein (TIGR02145 family)
MKTTTNFLISTFFIIGLLTFLSTSCKKDDKTGEITVKDIDGNIYKTVTIGSQVWMAENLKVTRYSNGDSIKFFNGYEYEWPILSNEIGACCDYFNLPENNVIYGKLYNWKAVNDSRNIAPSGWHVPSEAEWTILTNFLSGDSICGGKMKAIGTLEATTGLWSAPNSHASNSSGFSALPGGSCNGDFGFYMQLGYWAYFWSSTSINSIEAMGYYISFHQGNMIKHADNKNSAYSVRCIRN